MPYYRKGEIIGFRTEFSGAIIHNSFKSTLQPSLELVKYNLKNSTVIMTLILKIPYMRYS
jgi:hypothetical protein